MLSMRAAVVIAASSACIGYWGGKLSQTSTNESPDLFKLSTLKAKSILPQSQNVELTPLHQQDIKPVNTTAQILKYGFPGMDNLRSYEDFVLSYDKRLRVANWVLEHLTHEKVSIPPGGADRSKMKFIEDESIHEFHRATNKDYLGSGYDRGHLAAAANHRQSEKAMNQTFVLSNTAPQVGEGFNRDAWNNLEKYVRALARKFPNVYVCTGPLFLPRKEPDGKLYVKYEVIGPNNIAVPTHFFKVVLIEVKPGQYDLLSYVMPNQKLPNVKLHHFFMPLEMIERAAGLNFFQNVPKSSFRKIKTVHDS